MTAAFDGWLMVLAVALPSLGVLLAIGLGGRWPERMALLAAPVGLAVALAGTAVLAGTAYADFHNYRAPQNSGGDGGGGGSCSSDSGSSCSSGCGGCGGGD